MTLKLKFYKNENASEPMDELSLPIASSAKRAGLNSVYSGTIEWSRDAPDRWRRRAHFPDGIFVEAELDETTPNEALSGLYQVKLAYRPDYEPTTDKNGVFWDKNAKRMQLLRGASGRSKLRLLRRTNWTENFTFDAIAEFDINVEPPPDKKALLEKSLGLPINQVFNRSWCSSWLS